MKLTHKGKGTSSSHGTEARANIIKKKINNKINKTKIKLIINSLKYEEIMEELTSFCLFHICIVETES